MNSLFEGACVVCCFCFFDGVCFMSCEDCSALCRAHITLFTGYLCTRSHEPGLRRITLNKSLDTGLSGGLEH